MISNLTLKAYKHYKYIDCLALRKLDVSQKVFLFVIFMKFKIKLIHKNVSGSYSQQNNDDILSDKSW